jgi:N-acetylglucosaminyldiphosphoundecaprenol N-acetyl-beta-D-mannosaminyltransferase
MVITPESRFRVGPAEIDFVRLDDVAAALACGTLTGGVHLCNAYTLALADERPELAEVLAADAANLPDGMPLVWWAKKQGVESAARVYGPDLMERVLDVGREAGTKHYLFGSTPSVLAALQSAIEERWPGADVVGAESPPFRDLTDEELGEVAERADEVGATVVWVGMGTPKQDMLVHRMANLSGQAFVAIGAAFDFIAGTKRQAPRWIMKLGMEWAYRLATEPRRLWKRYLVYNWKFVRVLWRSRRQAPA